jgi:DNA topoisomerase-2
MTPWWFGFKGKVLSGGDGRTWITKGLYEFVDDDSATIRIKELPVGCWTQDYKDFLEAMLVEQEALQAKYIVDVKKAKDTKTEAPPKPAVWLRGYTSNYNDVDVDFELSMDPEYYHEARAYPADFETRFKLTTSYKTSNMVAFDTAGAIRRFATAGEILEQFYVRRLAAYGERKAHMLATMATEITELEARLTFVRAVVERRLVVANAEDADLLAGLQGLSLPALSGGEGLKGYEYLLRMRVDRLKAAAVAELTAEVAALKAKRDALEATSVETLWLTDLDTFASAWTDYVAWRNATYVSTAEVKKATPRKARVVKKTA